MGTPNSLMDTNNNLVYPSSAILLASGMLVLSPHLALLPGIPTQELVEKLRAACEEPTTVNELDLASVKTLPQRMPGSSQDKVYLEITFKSGPKVRKDIYTDLLIPYLDNLPQRPRHDFFFGDFWVYVRQQLVPRMAEQ